MVYGLASFILLVASASLATTDYCRDRTFERYNITLVANQECPYYLIAGDWAPGQTLQMEIVLEEGANPFQLFLISVQVNNSLIGQMSSDNSAAMRACNNGSAMHSDTKNKTSIVLTWTAPSNLTFGDIFARMSIGTLLNFWKDCEAFFLIRKETGEDPLPTTSLTTPPLTTLSTPPPATPLTLPRTPPLTSPATTPLTAPLTTSSRRLAGPDRVNDGMSTTNRLANPDTANIGGAPTVVPRNLKHRVVSSSACSENGNLYSVVPGSNCRQFAQQVGRRRYIMDCPLPTRFDVRKCACSFMSQKQCR